METNKYQELIKYIEQTNAQFEAASPEEKRVMVAQDVLERVKIKNLIPKTGSIISERDLETFSKGTSLKEVVNTTECRVCGKGALLCAFVGRVNKLTVEEFNSGPMLQDEDGDRININSCNKDGYAHLKLRELFSLEQLDLIECAFEHISYLYVAPERDRYKAYNFFCGYDDEEVLIAIMENIIENKGTFIP